MTSDHRIDGRLALPPSASFIPPASVLPNGQVDAIVAAQTEDIPPSVDTFGLDAATIKACLERPKAATAEPPLQTATHGPRAGEASTQTELTGTTQDQ